MDVLWAHAVAIGCIGLMLHVTSRVHVLLDVLVQWSLQLFALTLQMSRQY